jgi:hypothetical protein
LLHSGTIRHGVAMAANFAGIDSQPLIDRGQACSSDGPAAIRELVDHEAIV